VDTLKRYYKSYLSKLIDYAISRRLVDLSQLHTHVVEQIENDEAVFITEHKRPKNSADFNIKSQLSSRDESVAIVLQGPILTTDDFTYQTLLLYAKNFKNAILIVSTWADEDEETIKKIQSTGAIVIQNGKPAIAGNAHINYQITSANSGILKARELGAAYVMKTRTDQRVYGLNVTDHFLNLMETYPLKNTSVQKQRLIVPNINTFLYRMYGITDMLMFGDIQDMILYWSAEHDNRIIPDEKDVHTVKEFANLRVSEIYLCTEFLKKTGKKIEWTIADSWQVFASNFCIVDYQSIDLYWPKYLPHTEYRNRYYTANNTHQLIAFTDWLSLYHNNYLTPPDTYLQYKVGESFVL
jgi:hypothetical protein